MRLLPAVVVVLSACAPHAPTGPRGTLVVGRGNDVLGLDPARVSDSESAEVCEQIFDHLVRYRRDSMEIEPALATSWDTSPDGQVWTFHLRDKVRFHDGTPFDADAVVFSFERQRDSAHPHHQADFTYWDSSYRNIMRVDKVDRLTVRISIDRPYAPFLASLAMFPVSIVSPTAVQKWGPNFARHPVGTGPFRFVEWAEGERVTLTANTDYYEGPPRVEHLVFSVVRDPRQRLVALEGETLDFAENLDPEDLQFVSLHPNLVVHRVAGSNVGYLAMNVTKPPFDDVRVRRAVNYAVNRNAIVKLVYQGLAVEATTAVPPSVWGHVDEREYSYDPAHARQLLAEAGYTPPGPGKPRPVLYTMDTSRPYMPSPELVARIIQHNLHDVGIDVDIKKQDINKHLASTQRGEHDLCLLGWVADNGDPDNFLFVLFDSENAEPGNARNLAFYRSGELHGVLVWAQESSDRPDRELYYKKAQDLISRDAPWVPIAHAEAVVAARAGLRGIVVHPTGLVYFHRVAR